MKLKTMAAVMSFVSKLEGDSAAFYSKWAEKYHDQEEAFTDWAEENKKFAKSVKQTYFGMITDAIESTFSFALLDTSAYEYDTTLPDEASLQEVMEKSREMEERILNFYRDASQQSEGLLVDISRLFKNIAQRRNERLQA